MTQYQPNPPQGQTYYYPPQSSPEYYFEKRQIRHFSNIFGIAALIYFAVNFGAGFVLQFILQLFNQLSGGWFFGRWEVSYYLLNLIVYVLSFVAAFGTYLAILRIPWRVAVPFRPVKTRTVILSIPVSFAVGVLGSIVASILSTLISFTGFMPVTDDLPAPTTVLGTVLYFILLVVLPPVFEEISFRGILMQSLRTFGDGFALVISSLIFGLFHLNLVQAPYAFLLGLWLGYLVLRTGSLRISMVLHACINLSAGIMTMVLDGAPDNVVMFANLFYLIFWTVTGVVCLVFLILHANGSLRLYPAHTVMRPGQKAGAYFTSVGMIFALIVIVFYTLQNFERII